VQGQVACLQVAVCLVHMHGGMHVVRGLPRHSPMPLQVAAGRVTALQAMWHELLSQAAAAFPTDTAIYQ